MTPHARHVLLIEFEDVQIYINSIILQAIVSAKHISIIPAEEEMRSIQMLIASSPTAISLLTEGVEEGILLENTQMQIYLRALAAATFLVKVFVLIIILIWLLLTLSSHLHF